MMFNPWKKWQALKDGLRDKNRLLYYIADWTETIVVALILALIIRTWIVQTSEVISGSMIPTIEIGDRVLVNKFIFNFRAPQRGEVILFKYPKDPSKDFVKRVMGLPGETLQLKDGQLYINDKMVPQSRYGIRNDFANFGPYKVPAGSYFMLGDNRANSADSRVWGIVPKENLIGLAFVTFWPPPQFRWLF
jgi:signal peptidase I